MNPEFDDKNLKKVFETLNDLDTLLAKLKVSRDEITKKNEVEKLLNEWLEELSTNYPEEFKLFGEKIKKMAFPEYAIKSFARLYEINMNS